MDIVNMFLQSISLHNVALVNVSRPAYITEEEWQLKMPISLLFFHK